MVVVPECGCNFAVVVGGGECHIYLRCRLDWMSLLDLKSSFIAIISL